MQTLNKILESNSSEFYEGFVPSYIYSNLKKGYGQRLYQREAFGRFVYYQEQYKEKPLNNIHLLYHMATGSGKTVVMAGLIIYLYQQGYRNFLFFVNSSTIIEKTKDNFLNEASSKYLFTQHISIEGKTVNIKEVNNFQSVNNDDINIIFSTIQGLHSKLTLVKENNITYDDFEDKKIALISDEAHHINTATKKRTALNADEREEIISWETTVNSILKSNKDNMLIEFTATADLSTPQIQKKYNDNLIYDYPLKQFRRDGYSKEVKLLQSNLPSFERALAAILLSQYRRKLFENNKQNIKPVILFKSKTIKESQAFLDEFVTGIKTLKATTIKKIKKENSNEMINKAFLYFEKNAISIDNLITELQQEFSEEKLLFVNSKDETEQKQIAVNSLEDDDNKYRAIFAVDKLNEGWDVLNLFDIVRLYNSGNGKDSAAYKTTMSEAQLIGRGARYCPFQTVKNQPVFTRKFDEDINNELRICEELYYHSTYNPFYIKQLNNALEEIGIKSTPSELNLPVNKDIDNRRKRKNAGKDIYEVRLKELKHKTVVIHNHFSDNTLTNPEIYSLQDIDDIIIRKALNKLDFYRFSNLKEIFPSLTSITEFINSPSYLGNGSVKAGGRLKNRKNISPEIKLEIGIQLLKEFSIELALFHIVDMN